MRSKGGFVFALLFPFVLVSVALAAETTKKPSTSSEFDFAINNQCPEGKGIGYNEHVGRMEKYCPKAAPSAPPSQPASPGGGTAAWLFRLFSRPSQLAAVAAATCEESEKLTNYYFTECQGKHEGIEVKGYCVAAKKCHANAYKDENGKWKTITGKTDVASAGGGGAGAGSGSGCDSAKTKLCSPSTGSGTPAPTDPASSGSASAGKGTEAPSKPASSAGKGESTGSVGQGTPVGSAGEGGGANTNQQSQQATLGQAGQQVGEPGLGGDGGSVSSGVSQEGTGGVGAGSGFQGSPGLSQTGGMQAPGGSGGSASVGGSGSVGSSAGSSGGSGSIASSQGAPSSGSTFSSSQPVGSGGSGSSGVSGSSGGGSSGSGSSGGSQTFGSSPAGSSLSSGSGSGLSSLSSGASTVFSAFTGFVSSFVSSAVGSGGGGGGGGTTIFSPQPSVSTGGAQPSQQSRPAPAQQAGTGSQQGQQPAFSPPVDLGLGSGQGQQTLAQPQLRQSGLLTAQTVPVAFEAPSAVVVSPGSGGSLVSSNFDQLPQPSLVSSLPDWAGGLATGSDIPLLMSLGGSGADGIASTASTRGVLPSGAGQTGGVDRAGVPQAGAVGGKPGGGGQSVAGGRGSDARGGGEGARDGTGVPGRTPDSVDLEAQDRPFDFAAESDAFFNAQGPGSFGEAMRTIQENLFVKGISSAAHTVWKFFQDSVGCQIAGGCEEEEGIVMVGRASFLLSGDAVVNAFKSYGNDLPSPAVVSQIVITGERPMGIVERVAPLLSVVGEGVRSIQTALWGRVEPQVRSSDGQNDTVRPVARGTEPGPFNAQSVEQPAPSMGGVEVSGAQSGGSPLAPGGVRGGAGNVPNTLPTGAVPGASAPVIGQPADVTTMESSNTASDTTMTDLTFEDGDLTPTEWFGSVLEERVTRLQAFVARVTSWFARIFS